MTSETALSADQIFDLADECRLLSTALENYRLRKRARNEITNNQSDEITAFGFDLLSAARRLGTIASDKVIETDLKQAGENITQATKKLRDALSNLQQINKILGVLASFINLVGAVVSAVVTPGLPGVANIFQAFQDLSNSLSV
jgi:hypothetical protein